MSEKFDTWRLVFAVAFIVFATVLGRCSTFQPPTS